MAVYAFIFAVFVLGGFVKGIVGLGLPTVTVGLLSLVMAPVEAAAILVVPSLVTNVWQCGFGRQLVALLKRLFMLLAALCVGVWLGAGLFSASDVDLALVLLGASLVLYSIVGLLSIRVHVTARHERWVSPLVGVITGVVTAATGSFVVPLVPYLQSLAFTRDELVQALGISFTVATIALGIALARGGVLDGEVAGVSTLALVPALLGMWIGQHVRSRISAEAFRRWFFVALLVLGLHLAARPLL